MAHTKRLLRLSRELRAMGFKSCKRIALGSIKLNLTQAVIVSLVQPLLKAIYHVFLDNLFSSLSLFLALHHQNIGAIGTCRTNSGIFKGFIEAKKDDTCGVKLWHHNEVRTVPTPDHQVFLYQAL